MSHIIEHWGSTEVCDFLAGFTPYATQMTSSQALARAESIVRDTAGGHIQHPEFIEVLDTETYLVSFWRWSEKTMRFIEEDPVSIFD